MSKEDSIGRSARASRYTASGAAILLLTPSRFSKTELLPSPKEANAGRYGYVTSRVRGTRSEIGLSPIMPESHWNDKHKTTDTDKPLSRAACTRKYI